MKFDRKFFEENRERLVAALSDSYVLITANSLLQRSADVTHPFEQDRNFWYLTGIDEPDMVLGIDTSSGKSTLFLPEQNDYQKEWDGEFDQEELKKTSGVDEIRFKADLNQLLKQSKKQGLEIGYLKPLDVLVEPYNFYSNPARRNLEELICEVSDCKAGDIKDVRLEIARLRQVKQPAEIEAIQKAIDITGEALAVGKDRLTDLQTEKDLERLITAEFYSRGADGHGYSPIIAGGKSAAIIHYEGNSEKLAAEDVLLLDVGAQVGYYSADISRAWSIGGKPNERQKEIYEAVIDLQQKAFDLLGPGVKLRDYQKQMDKVAVEAAKKLGIEMDKFPHGFSHFLGLDVHDAGDYDLPLAENMILTVEPGLYLLDEGIGVRIEDIIRITSESIEIMSKNIPRDL